MSGFEVANLRRLHTLAPCARSLWGGLQARRLQPCLHGLLARFRRLALDHGDIGASLKYGALYSVTPGSGIKLFYIVTQLLLL